MSKREFKFCEYCKTKFHRDGERQNNWNSKRFCNDICQHKNVLEARRLEREAEAKRKKGPHMISVTDFWLYKYRPVGV